MNDIIDDLNNGPETDWSIPYYDNMTEEQQKEITDSIRLLLRQTFVLERKYDKQSVCSILPLTVSLPGIFHLSAIIWQYPALN